MTRVESELLEAILNAGCDPFWAETAVEKIRLVLTCEQYTTGAIKNITVQVRKRATQYNNTVCFLRADVMRMYADDESYIPQGGTIRY
mgnify:CR=1 FL=1